MSWKGIIDKPYEVVNSQKKIKHFYQITLNCCVPDSLLSILLFYSESLPDTKSVILCPCVHNGPNSVIALITLS